MKLKILFLLIVGATCLSSEKKMPDNPVLQEYFCDSVNIGRKSLNKIELTKYDVNDSNFVIIKFFSKSNGNKWVLKNKYEFEKDGVTGCSPHISDFNNDGLNDFTYQSGVAARGANEVRRLFIYDAKQDRLIYMKNSEDYPNMRYNKDLNCIDAFLVYGGCSTVFLHIAKDSLIEFASVELDEHINVRVIDKTGKEKYLIRDNKNDMGVFVRFKNFSPLTVAEDY